MVKTVIGLGRLIKLTWHNQSDTFFELGSDKAKVVFLGKTANYK